MNLFRETLLKSQKEDYINADDIEELVYNPELCAYFDAAMDSIDDSRLHKINPEGDRKQIAKALFSWIKNYDPKLEKNPVDFANIVFKIYYGEDIYSCDGPRGTRFTIRDGRKAFADLPPKS